MKCGEQVRGDPYLTSWSSILIWTPAAESDLSLKSRSSLHRVNVRLRKILDHSSEDAMQEIDKLSMIWGMFMSSTVEALYS